MPDTLIRSLEKGDYSIETKAACECSFGWSLTAEPRQLVCVETAWNCFNTAMLNVGDRTILTFSHGDPVFVVVSGTNISDIPSNVLADMMKVSNDCNQLHNMRKRQSLVQWLVNAGYKIEIENMRIGVLQLRLLDVGRPYRPTVEDAGTFADGFLEKAAHFTYKKAFA